MTSTYAHHFSLSNLPLGIASSAQHHDPGAATRIGDTVVFLDVLAKNGCFSGIDGLPDNIFGSAILNNFAALPSSVHSSVRQTLQKLLDKEELSHLPEGSHEDISNVTLHLPFQISDFTGVCQGLCISGSP
jgi:fumarylacetoacetase